MEIAIKNMDQVGTETLANQTQDMGGTDVTMADATAVIGVVIDTMIATIAITAMTTALNIAVTAATIAVGTMSVIGTDAEMIVTQNVIIETTGRTMVATTEDALPAPLINMIGVLNGIAGTEITMMTKTITEPCNLQANPARVILTAQSWPLASRP